MSGRRLGVFIDAENVGNVKLRPLVDDLLAACRDRGIDGEIAVARAYAGWDNDAVRRIRRQLPDIGAIEVDVEASRDHVSNASDIHLAVDALSEAHLDPALDTFIVVSGDSGFVPLFRKLRAMGRFVVGVSRDGKAGTKAIDACDAYFVFAKGTDGSQRSSSPRRSERAMTEWAERVQKVVVNLLAEANPVSIPVVREALRVELKRTKLSSIAPVNDLPAALAIALVDSAWCIYRDPDQPEVWLVDERDNVPASFETKIGIDPSRLPRFRGAGPPVEDDTLRDGETSVTRIVLPPDAFDDED